MERLPPYLHFSFDRRFASVEAVEQWCARGPAISTPPCCPLRRSLAGGTPSRRSRRDAQAFLSGLATRVEVGWAKVRASVSREWARGNSPLALVRPFPPRYQSLEAAGQGRVMLTYLCRRWYRAIFLSAARAAAGGGTQGRGEERCMVQAGVRGAGVACRPACCPLPPPPPLSPPKPFPTSSSEGMSGYAE